MFTNEESRPTGFDLINHAIKIGSVGEVWTQGVNVPQQQPSLERNTSPHQPAAGAGGPPILQSSNSQSFQFPWKLHDMLEQAENDGLTDIVSWQDDGKSFRVKKPTAFVEKIMPMYFKVWLCCC